MHQPKFQATFNHALMWP